MASEEDRIQSIDSLAERQDRTEGKLDQLIALVTGRKQTPDTPEAEGGRPGDVAGQVRAELARAKQEQDAAAAADASKQEQETLAQRVAKLEERTPEPPQPRRQRVMWGNR